MPVSGCATVVTTLRVWSALASSDGVLSSTSITSVVFACSRGCVSPAAGTETVGISCPTVSSTGRLDSAVAVAPTVASIAYSQSLPARVVPLPFVAGGILPSANAVVCRDPSCVVAHFPRVPCKNLRRSCLSSLGFNRFAVVGAVVAFVVYGVRPANSQYLTSSPLKSGPGLSGFSPRDPGFVPLLVPLVLAFRFTCNVILRSEHEVKRERTLTCVLVLHNTLNGGVARLRQPRLHPARLLLNGSS